MVRDTLSQKSLFVAGLLLFALACSQAANQVQPEEPAATMTPRPSPTATTTATPQPSPTATATAEALSQLTLRTPAEPPPRVDTSIASVAIEDVVFDTFRGGFIRLSEASDEDIEFLRNRIPPIYEPRYTSAEEGRWLRDYDVVIGCATPNGAAFAYPIRILNFHEIVNDVIDGEPVLVSYCPLCASAVVYSRDLNGRVLLFGNTSALYESDMVMYDQETGSYWFQVIGEAIVGPLTGARLRALPSMTTTWSQWRELHPSTKVLSRDLGLFPVAAFDRGNPYDSDPFADYVDHINGGRFPFPVTEENMDSRLRAGAMVFAVEVGDEHKAYLLTGGSDWVISDEVGGETLVVLYRGAAHAAAAYLSTVDGRALSFNIDTGVLEDAETGSRWDDGGRAVSGPMAGTQLKAVPSRTSYWFSIVGAVPGIELHKP